MNKQKSCIIFHIITWIEYIHVLYIDYSLKKCKCHFYLLSLHSLVARSRARRRGDDCPGGTRDASRIGRGRQVWGTKQLWVLEITRWMGSVPNIQWLSLKGPNLRRHEVLQTTGVVPMVHITQLKGGYFITNRYLEVMWDQSPKRIE